MAQEAVIWEPFYWQPATRYCALSLTANLEIEDPDWSEFYYRDTNPSDGSVGDCSRYWADLMGWCSGFTLITTHCYGSDGYNLILAAADQNAIEEWVGEDSDNMEIDGPYFPPYGLYAVFVSPDYCEDKWQYDHTRSRSIVYLATCFGYPNFTSAAGGVTQFGCTGTDPWTSHNNNLSGILSRMNGEIGNGNYRIASDAYSNMTVYGTLQMSGGNSTLAPAPINTNPVWPIVSGAGASGSGYIEFDSIMDTSVSPSSALTWTVITGTASVSNIEWNNNHKITFSYSGSLGYIIEMTADKDYCVTKIVGGGKQPNLNGNPEYQGEDYKVWTFFYWFDILNKDWV